MGVSTPSTSGLRNTHQLTRPQQGDACIRLVRLRQRCSRHRRQGRYGYYPEELSWRQSTDRHELQDVKRRGVYKLTSSSTIRPPGLKTLKASLNRLALPVRGNKLMTQLDTIQSIESEAMGRGSVKDAWTKAACGGRRSFFCALRRASDIMSCHTNLSLLRSKPSLKISHIRHVKANSLACRPNFGRRK
jgi:hypothetical protein